VAVDNFKGHGVFTYCLLDGIKGAADLDQNGQVTSAELATYVIKEVPVQSYKKYGYKQEPQRSQPKFDFPMFGRLNELEGQSLKEALEIAKLVREKGLDLEAATAQVKEVYVGTVVVSNDKKKEPAKADKKVEPEPELGKKENLPENDEVWGELGKQATEKKEENIAFPSQHSRAYEHMSYGLDIGYAVGDSFNGIDFDNSFMFFGGKHVYGGLGLDWMALDYGRGMFPSFIDFNFLIGVSGNIGILRPYIVGNLGYYLSATNGIVLGTKIGTDITFLRHFSMGFAYKLQFFSKAGWIDVYAVTLSWDW